MRRVVRKTTSTSSSSKARRLEGGSEGNLPPYFTDTHRNPSTSNVTAPPHPSCTLEKTSIEEKIKKILLSTALQELPTRTKMKHHTLVGKESKNVFSHWCFIYLSFTVPATYPCFHRSPITPSWWSVTDAAAANPSLLPTNGRRATSRFKSPSCCDQIKEFHISKLPPDRPQMKPFPLSSSGRRHISSPSCVPPLKSYCSMFRQFT